MKCVHRHSRKLNESKNIGIDLNTATTSQMEEFLADNNLDIEIVDAFSEECDRLIIKQGRKTSIVNVFSEIRYFTPLSMDIGELAIFKDEKLYFVTSREMLSDYGFKAEKAWWDAWIKDSSFNNRKHIILKFLIKYYFALV